MYKIFNLLGWALLAAGLVGGVLSYFVVSSQDFVLALLARVVERPFEYRTYVALLSACGIALAGCLLGLHYLGMARLLEGGNSGDRRD